MLISRSIHFGEMALFHFSWWIMFHYMLCGVLIQALQILGPYTCQHEGPLMVKTKPRFPRRILPRGLGLWGEFIFWHGAPWSPSQPHHPAPSTRPDGPLQSGHFPGPSTGSSLHFGVNKVRKARFRMRIEGLGANSFTSDFLSNENLTLKIWRTAQFFFKLLI